MKTIITLDKANQPYGFPQLNGNGNFGNIIVESGLTATTISATTYYGITNPTSGYVPYNNAGIFADTVIYYDNAKVGVGTPYPSNKLHVYSTSDPLKLVGLQAATDSNVLTVDGSGVVHTYPVSSLTGGTSSAFTGGTVSGATNFTNGLTANTISATTYYNYPDTFVTGFTLSSNTITLTQNRTDGYSSFTISLSAYTGNTSTSGAYLPLSGGTVTGDTVFQSGLTANTISATTYYNVNAVTGGTYSSGTITLSGTGGVNGNTITGFPTSFPYFPLSGGTVTGGTVFQSGLTANTLNVTGNTLLSGLTAVTISATTYYNINAVTGGTYSNGTITLSGTGNFASTITGFAIGGGGGQIFYLNLSQSQNGNRFLSTTASTASEQTSGVTIGSSVTGSIASFQTTPLNISLIPGGIWSFYLHSYKQNNNSSFNIFVEVYKITSGGSQTLLFATDPAPVTTNSPNPSMQLTDGYFSGTSLNVSDGVVAVVKATNTSNQSHSITLVTEGSQHYSYVVSTIPTQQGLTCETLSGCSIIQTINTDISNKFDKSGGTVSGATNFTSGLTANTISATTYSNLPSQSGTGISAFAYVGSTGLLTITKNDTTTLTAGTFSYLTAATLSAANVLSVASNGGSPTATTINAVTGGSYSNGTITLSGTGNFQSTITGFSTSTATAFTGGTVSGATNFTGGVTANTLTVSAATDPVKFVGLQSASDTSLLTVDGTGVIHTLSTSSVGLTWNNALTATTSSSNNGYVGTATTLTTITLPTGATFGTIIEVVGTGTGLWRISQNANQFIKFGITGTTTGVTGYLSATSQYDCVKLLCTSASTAFVVTSAIGNIFYN